MRTATIVIRDEVNIKIEGLELDARRSLVNAFKYDVPGARYLPAVRLGRWDGKVSYFQLGGSTYVNLLPEIIPILEKFNYDIDLNDQRDYSTTFEFEKVSEQTFSHIAWGPGHPLEGKPMELRDYQVEIINNFLENPQCIQEIATGAGKTVVTAALSNAVAPYGRTIVIVPRDYTERPQSITGNCSYMLKADNLSNTQESFDWIEKHKSGEITIDVNWLGEGRTSELVLEHLKTFLDNQ